MQRDDQRQRPYLVGHHAALPLAKAYYRGLNNCLKYFGGSIRLSKLLVHGQTMDNFWGPIALQGFRHMFL